MPAAQPKLTEQNSTDLRLVRSGSTVTLRALSPLELEQFHGNTRLILSFYALSFIYNKICLNLVLYRVK